MTDFLSTIAKVRRDMPRNASVMSLCDELERRLVDKTPVPVIRPKIIADDANEALERLRATKRKAQKKWYHGSKDRRRAEKRAQ